MEKQGALEATSSRIKGGGVTHDKLVTFTKKGCHNPDQQVAA